MITRLCPYSRIYHDVYFRYELLLHSRIIQRALTIDVNANDKFSQTRFSHYKNCELIDSPSPNTVDQLMQLFSRYL